jgi:hypothetical protein
MKTIIKRCTWLLVVIAIFAIAPAITPVQCTPPKQCPGGVNNENGQSCGIVSLIETDTTISYTANWKFCTKYNPLYVCEGDCNENEWWAGEVYKVNCVNQQTGAKTFLYYCYHIVSSRTRAGEECALCPDEL